MTPLIEWLRRLAYLVNRRRIDRALSEEMDAHRAEMAGARAFGNTLRLREEARDVWGWAWLDDLSRECRVAWRALRRTPLFSLGAILSLGLGLALFSSSVAVVNAYLIRSLPYPSAESLFHVMYAPPGPWEPRGLSGLDWTSVGDVVEFPIAAVGETVYTRDGSYTPSLRMLRVTPGFVGGLGVASVAGRSLVAADFQTGAEPAALISHALWRDRFAMSPAAIGQSMVTETEAGRSGHVLIVGVLRPDFYYGRDSSQRVDVLLPMTAPAPTHVYLVRLRAGVPAAVAERRLTEAVRTVATDLPADWTGVHLESAHERYVGSVRPILIGVMAAAALVLVVAGANVAVLTVLRTLRREKELTVRVALGSSRRHLIRMLAVEATLLTLAAFGLSLLLTHFALSSIAPLVETELGRPAPGGTSAIGIDRTVLLIAAVVTTAMATWLTLMPWLLIWKAPLADSLRRTSAAATPGRATHRLRSAMVAFEIAMTLVLCVGCGLLVRSVATMARTDLGFDPERLVRARIALRSADYRDEAAFASFYRQFVGRVPTAAAAPVVFSSWPAFAEFPEQAVEIDGHEGHVARAGVVNVGAEYFTTIGIALRSGRDISTNDLESNSPVAVISESLARRLWPEAQALGRSLRQVEVTAGGPRPPGPWRTVVGVAADVRQSYGDRNPADVYVPYWPSGRFASFFVRTDRALPSIVPDLLAVAASIDPHAVVDLPHRLTDDNRELAGTRVLMSLLGGFSLIAAFVAALGIQAVTSYAVRQRTREVAIRLALGASPTSVTRSFLRDGGVSLMTGLAIGVAGSLGTARLLAHHVFAVDGFDAAILLAACSLVSASALVAAWWPARRAARTSPAAVLKEG